MSELPDRRTKAYRDLISLMPRPDGYIEEELDGIRFRYKPEYRCRVCSCDDPRKALPNAAQVKKLVDDLIMYPKDLMSIYRTIEPLMESWPAKHKITYKSLRNHQKRHLAWDALALRMMVERWAREKGISIIDAAGRMLLTEEAWLEATVHKGWQQLVTGQISPTWGETQAAFNRIAQLRQQAEGQFDKVTILAQLNAIIEAVREVVPPELWPKIIEHIERRERGLPDSELASEERQEELFNELLREQEELGGD